MILQALVKLYEDLAARGDISPSGWSETKISYALCLDQDGTLVQLIPLLEEQTTGKKTVLRPQSKKVPAAVKRSSGVASNFLWDNASYLLGVDGKGKPERSAQCFQACRELHHKLLDPVDTPAAKAILRFFDTWDPGSAAEHPVMQPELDTLFAGGNLLFRVQGIYATEDTEIRAAWQSYYDSSEGDRMQCLVTGREDVIEATHPSIKGVAGAQSSGAALVSFNAPAFCSYGREQNFNAPVGKYAAFAYTTALNHLLADRDNVQRIGDTTVVCWAEGADPAYRPLVLGALFGQEQPEWTEKALRDTVKRLANQEPVEEYGLDPDRTFYILGLAPNAARLSVRFFFRDTFGNLMKHINAHHERMEIVRPAYDPYPTIPLWAMLRETVNQNTKDKEPSPVMAGATARAIFSGGPYPAALLTGVMLRIRAERNITRGRAAIIKAYYRKNQHPDCPEEVLTVALNENSTNIPYTLGRLFSLYEAVQQSANPGINTTIKDKYFNGASSTPGTIFPVLDTLYPKHLRKLDGGLKVYYDRQVMQIKGILGEEYPLRLSLPQQGSFNLGYYHQTQKRYEKNNKADTTETEGK